MKFQLFCTALGLTAFTLIMSISPSFSQVNNRANSQNKVTFFCQEMLAGASSEKVMATLAWVPERQNYVGLIAWKSNGFGGRRPQKRCQEVSKKLQQFNVQGRLDYLLPGQNQGLPVICAVKINENCNSNNLVFTLKSGQDPHVVLQEIVSSATGTSSEAVWQISGGKKYLNVRNLLNNAPIINTNR